MFTGIIQALGKVKNIGQNESGKEFLFECSSVSKGLALGDSVSCNGVCLSATHISKHTFTCYAVKETLSKTSLGQLVTGDSVNFELAMMAETRVGGHFVSGHIDTKVSVSKVESLSDGSIEMSFSIPREFLKYCITKGSIAFNGVSLTIA